MTYLIILAISLVVSGFAYLIVTVFNEPLIKNAWLDDKQSIMHVTYSDDKVKQYIKAYGDWNDFPMMTFVGRSKNNELNNVYYYIRKWGNDYPTAHLNHKSCN